MTWTNLDRIVKGVLLEKGYPIHYYMQFLYNGSRCYEELNFDSLKNIKTVKLPVNSYNAVTLPCDYLDAVQVGYANGQFVRPMAQRQGISSLNNFDTNGNKVIHDSSNFTNNYYFQNYNTTQTFFNSNNEFQGRMFGLGSGDNPLTYKIIPERGEIQIHEQLAIDNIVLSYISDGTSIDNATAISPYAKGTIEAYIMWKHKEGSRQYGLQERQIAKQMYNNEHAKLRARIFGMTKDDIYYIIRKHTHGSIKG